MGWFEWFFVIAILFLCLLKKLDQANIRKAYAQQPVVEEIELPGSAKFMGERAELKALGLLGKCKSGIRLGYAVDSGKPLRFGEDYHITVIAPTGSGKTAGFVIPNVLALDDTSL